jgi:hypothetical protein
VGSCEGGLRRGVVGDSACGRVVDDLVGGHCGRILNGAELGWGCTVYSI